MKRKNEKQKIKPITGNRFIEIVARRIKKDYGETLRLLGRRR